MTVFVSVAFGNRYVEMQNRLKDSILDIYPDANLLFWTDELPPNSKPMDDSLYGFKVYAIREAINQGYTKIIYLDSCAQVLKPIDSLLDLAIKQGFVAQADSVKLFRYMSDEFLSYTGKINEDWYLVGGSLYIFDIEHYKGCKIFNEWESLEHLGYFGDRELVMNEVNDGVEKCGSRMDEMCMSWVMHSNGINPIKGDLDSLILRTHFIKAGEKWYNKIRE